MLSLIEIHQIFSERMGGQKIKAAADTDTDTDTADPETSQTHTALHTSWELIIITDICIIYIHRWTLDEKKETKFVVGVKSFTSVKSSITI